jgi:HAE1 family hydrophobic/amphiphilic exporter-1
MNISQTFIERPIATSLLMAAIALFGAWPTTRCRSAISQRRSPHLLVTAACRASPDTMAAAVATPLENQFSTIAGLSSMTFPNSLGNTQITLEFDLSRKLDGAAVDVQARSRRPPPAAAGHAHAADFHQGQSRRPAVSLHRADLAHAALVDLDEYAETRIAQRISMISGVAQVQVLGAQKYACMCRWIRTPWPRARSASTKSRPRSRTGTSICPPAPSSAAARLHAAGQRQLLTADQYRRWWWPTATARRCVWMNSAPSSTAWKTIRPPPGSTRQIQSRAIVLAIQRQPGTNTIAVTDGVKNLLPVFRRRTAAIGQHGHPVRPFGHHPRSLHDVQFTMLLTLGLVVMVIFLFLRNCLATIIPAWRCRSPSSARSP